MELLHNPTFLYIVIAVAAFIILLLLINLPRIYLDRYERLRREAANGEAIYYKDFLDEWIVAGKPNRKKGYKYNDFSGCYVITIYNRKLIPYSRRKYLAYKNVYVGQSINVHQRVRNHLVGKGNGDVYADVKYGKEAYVRFFPCRREKMNDLEKMLIGAFCATESYNKTEGGSAGW